MIDWDAINDGIIDAEAHVPARSNAREDLSGDIPMLEILEDTPPTPSIAGLKFQRKLENRESFAAQFPNQRSSGRMGRFRAPLSTDAAGTAEFIRREKARFARTAANPYFQELWGKTSSFGLPDLLNQIAC